MANDSTKIIPGHEPLGNTTSLRQNRDMLAGVQTRLMKFARQKRTVAQVLAAKPITEFDATWRTGFLTPEQFLTIAYTSVTKRLTRETSRAHHKP
jgi:cyclase